MWKPASFNDWMEMTQELLTPSQVNIPRGFHIEAKITMYQSQILMFVFIGDSSIILHTLNCILLTPGSFSYSEKSEVFVHSPSFT